MAATIGLVYDLRSEYLARGHSAEEVVEFDSDETIDAIEGAVRSLGYRTERIGNGRALCAALVEGRRWDLVFNVAEGLEGRCRESQVPALLELYGVPYTFSDPLVSAATLDKSVAKRLVAAAGLATPRFAVVRGPADVAGISLDYPMFAKPLAEGTGKGIDGRSRIDTAARLEEVCLELLARFDQPVLVEEYLPGREFTTGVLGTAGEARVLGTMEVEVLDERTGAIYSSEVKERCEELVRYSPLAEPELRRDVEDLALRAYVALECRDAGRVDVRLDASGQPTFMELNPLPGLHSTHSDLPMIATQEGMTYEELIGAIVASALTRAEAPDGS